MNVNNELSKEDMEYILEQYDAIKNLNIRTEGAREQRSNDPRSEWQRDYAHILYSSSFRRLQGKMQLIGLTTDNFYRNRLTHSLEVEQIAEGIINVLNSKLKKAQNSSSSEGAKEGKSKEIQYIYNDNDIYVVRAACLAHDIGNPPFGHAGEKILNDIMKKYGGYEGNAQTLRILKKLEKKDAVIEGLNLTLRTELGLLKYYKKRETEDTEKFIYDSDYEDISSKIYINNLDYNIRTLDAQIMDLADEIAYCAHDLEDCLGLEVFDIDEFLYELKLEVKKNDNIKEKGYLCGYKTLNKMVIKAKREARKCNRLNTLEEYKDILKLEITGQIVNLLITDIGVVTISDKDITKFGTLQEKQLGFKNYSKLAKCIKNLTFKCLKRKKHVKLYEEQGEIIIRSLFKLYTVKPELMATEYFNMYEKDKGNKENLRRIVCDYISGMMDNYAFKKYEEFFGEISLNHLLKSNWQQDFEITE